MGRKWLKKNGNGWENAVNVFKWLEVTGNGNNWLDQTLRIWLGTQFSRPTPELGPLQAEF